MAEFSQPFPTRGISCTAFWKRVFSDEPQLVELDWFGDTTFNRLQMPRFLSMWRAVAGQARTADDEELVNRVKELAERCQSSIHLYLKFVGE